MNSFFLNSFNKLFFFFILQNSFEFEFIAPSIELIPLKCKEKMARSTAPPEWALIDDNGGYQFVLAG